jgi:hypothetical protein
MDFLVKLHKGFVKELNRISSLIELKSNELAELEKRLSEMHGAIHAMNIAIEESAKIEVEKQQQVSEKTTVEE